MLDTFIIIHSIDVFYGSNVGHFYNCIVSLMKYIKIYKVSGGGDAEGGDKHSNTMRTLLNT